MASPNAGLGKTTLASELYRKIGEQFECRAFVRTSKRPDIRRLLISMLSQVAPNYLPDNWKVHSLIDSVRTHLQDKRYLIVIDDVWTTSTWEIVERALPDGNRCSGILVTTEIEDVALRCCGYDSNDVFIMKPLGENDSSQLTFRIAFGPQHECPPELSEVSNSIIRKCGGLPLAIVTIASLLASRMGKAEQWDHVDKSLGYGLRKNPTMEGMRQVFDLCFNNLPQHLKACIMCLSIYQEDCIMWKDDLVKQWTAEGFVCATEEKDEEEISRSYFDELISSRLIQPVHINGNDEVLSCTVHHMVHNFITHKCIEENFVAAVDQSQTTTRLADKVRRLSLQFGNAEDATPPTNMRLSQVRTLAFFGVFKCVPSIVEFQLLQVLILHIWGDQESINLDISRISELCRLKYLQVTCNVILELRTQMRGLQFLPRLLHLNIPSQTRLPDGICHMTPLHTLRYFDLSSNSAENVLSLGGLTNLQDLQLACCAIETDNLKNNMQCLGTVLGKLSNLKSLTVVGSSHIGGDLSMSISGDGLMSMSSPPAFLGRFELSAHVCIFSSLPEWIGHLARLCILKIAVGELGKNNVDVLRELPALTVLSLYVCTNLAERIVFDKGGFSVLKYLKFRCSVPWLKFEEGALPNLQKLKLGFNAPGVDQRGGAASIIIDHLSGLQEISAKIGGASGDVESSALTAAISNHPINPRINMQFVDYTFHGDGSAKEKEEQVEILEEESNEHEKRQAELKLIDTSGGGDGAGGGALSRYGSQKQRDWNTFGQYLRNHRPPLSLAQCSGAHVVEFLQYLDQFGKTKVHATACPFYGHPNPPAPCPCPLRQAWGSLDALVGRLRAVFEDHGGPPESNPFAARAVRLFLREVREYQARARGVQYEKKKRRKPSTTDSSCSGVYQHPMGKPSDVSATGQDTQSNPSSFLSVDRRKPSTTDSSCSGVYQHPIQVLTEGAISSFAPLPCSSPEQVHEDPAES